jgi:predicted PurR-regulated permease PerM
MDWENSRRHFQTALIWASAAGLLFVLWEVRNALLLAFGGVLVAILLRLIASRICTWTRIPKQLGLVAATILILAVVGVTAWLFGSRLSSDFSNLLQQIQSGEKSLHAMLEKSGSQFGSTVTEQGTSLIANLITSIVPASIQSIAAIIVVAVTGIYLAAQPQLYRRGIAALFPARKQQRVFETLDLVEETLRLWLVGQIILMVVVGLFSFIAVWLIGLPTPGALGLIAGIAEIIPYFGPFIGAIPAALVALTHGFVTALWTGGAYLVIHIFEGYLIAPIIERYFIRIPPALVLIGIVTISLLFGTAGIVLGAPITAVVYVLIKMHYVDDPLEQDIKNSDLQ